MKTPFIVTPRLSLRLLVEEDAQQIHRWINKEDVRVYLNVYRPQAFEEEREWINKLSNKENDIVFGICLKETGDLIGCMGLHHIRLHEGTAITGAYIGDTEMRGKGYATEAKMHLLKYAFHTLRLHTLRSEVYAFNKASLRYVRACGYVEIGRLKDYAFADGKRWDVVIMQVIRDEWEERWEEYCHTYGGDVYVLS